MTWSIIARDPETGAFGVAVTTKFFAVGALCPFGAGRIGALATQAFVNPLYGTDGLQLLAEGRSAEEIVALAERFLGPRVSSVELVQTGAIPLPAQR